MKIFLVSALLVLFTVPSQCLVARHHMTSAKYQREFNYWVARGFRLKQVSGYSSNNGIARYAAIWVKNLDKRAWIARHGMTSGNYQKQFNTHVRNGFRLVLVSGYGVGNRAYYAAIWEKTRSGPWVARHGMTSRQYQSNFNKFTKAPYYYRVTCVSGYTVNSKIYYAAIWQKSDGRKWVARHGMNSSQYQDYFDLYTSRRFRLTIVSGYQWNGNARYAAVWERISGPPYYARHGMTGVNYQAAFDNQYYRGYRLEYVVGYLVGNTIRYAAIWHSRHIWKVAELQKIDNTVKSFLSTNAIPGASLAITRYGKLVFAQGYGQANVELNHDASPKNLWRIASISKPITSVAIMKLIELGKIHLSDKVFGPGSILGSSYAGGIYSAKEKAITVRQLLEHTAGGTTWNNKGKGGSSDPMFILNSYSHENLIKYVLQNREPSATPGTTYNYSNFGYCILGRIIEKVTGMSYYNWVKQNILNPMEATQMYIGGNTKAQRRYNEAIYYPGNWPYVMNVRRMDSHGGWITTPIDLLKFMVRVDGFSTVPDKLTSSTIQSMVQPSSLNRYYAKGWYVNSDNNWWHSGSLPGTMSILVRTSSGYTWSFICNKRGSGNIDSLMWTIVNGVSMWPNHNFF